MGYITAKEAAEKWGVSTRRVQVLCDIPGVVRFGSIWAIPEDAAAKTAPSWRGFSRQVF